MMMCVPVLQQEIIMKMMKMDAQHTQLARPLSALLPLASPVQITPAQDHQSVRIPMESFLMKTHVVVVHTSIAPPEQDSFVTQPTIVVVVILVLSKMLSQKHVSSVSLVASPLQQWQQEYVLPVQKDSPLIQTERSRVYHVSRVSSPTNLVHQLAKRVQ
jgi:hypothetical protein